MARDEPDLTAGGREPGWYADPSSPGHWRWWDGTSFTEHAVDAEGPRRRGTGGTGAGAGATTGASASTTVPPGRADGGAETVPLPPAPDRTQRLERPERQGRTGRGRRRQPPRVLARRWGALAVVVAVVVTVLVIALRGHPMALYWQGEQFSNGGDVLSQAEAAMASTARANEAAIASSSQCYFVLPNRSAHDVEPHLACGPVLFPWSARPAAWLEYPLSARPGAAPLKLDVSTPSSDTTTVALAGGVVLRRPSGGTAPKGFAGLSRPVVPYQAATWSSLLTSLPGGLRSASVSDVLGGWAHSFRLVAFGTFNHLSASLAPGALRQAVTPKGSKWSTTGKGAPRATVLVPEAGHELVVAQLAVSPGEASGAVPAGAAASGGASGTSSTTAQFQVTSSYGADVLSVPARPGSSLFVAASVPVGSAPELAVTDKGLAQSVSLSNGQVTGVPGVLARLSPAQVLRARADLGGVYVRATNAALVWFAGSDGGTVPPNAGEAYLQVLVTVSPLSASFLPASDFSLSVPGRPALRGELLPDSDRRVIAVGFIVPASFSTGTLDITVSGRVLAVPLNFP